MIIAPAVAYHGTSTVAIDGISKTGFLLSKLGGNTGNKGFYGAGVYCSKNAQISVGYARDGQLLVCAVLMGKIYKCPGMMTGAPLQSGFDSHESPCGNEWVVFRYADFVCVCLLLFFSLLTFRHTARSSFSHATSSPSGDEGRL